MRDTLLMDYSYLSDKRGLFLNLCKKIIPNFKNCNSEACLFIQTSFRVWFPCLTAVMRINKHRN